MSNVYTKKLAILGFFFISIIGTLSHFAYEWLGSNKLLGGFFAVNESTWEHLKIAIIPTFIWLILVILFSKVKTKNFFEGNLLAMIATILTIIILFYGYKLFFKEDSLIYDIVIFYIAIGIGQFLIYKLSKYKELSKIYSNISKLLLVVILLKFIVFTYYTPKMEIFRDPINNSYGILI